MEHQAIFLSGRPRPTSPISPGIRLGDVLYTSGQTGANSDGKIPADIREQTRNTFETLKAILGAAGSSLDNVLKVTVYLTDMKDFAAMNEVYRTFFTGTLPARTTVGVVALAGPELRVEIEMVAHIQT